MVLEGNGGTQNALVAVTLSTPSTQSVKVNHSNTAGSDDLLLFCGLLAPVVYALVVGCAMLFLGDSFRRLAKQ